MGTGLLAVWFENDRPWFGWSMGSAWVALLYFALTLSIGPWRWLRGMPTGLSSFLRRDIGIWTALLALVHTGAGLQVHLGGDVPGQFFRRDEMSGELTGLLLNLAGIANYTGLIVAVILLLLLSLSNNMSLRRLGSQRWKSLQRLAYIAALLLPVHGLAYQWIERRPTIYVLIFGVCCLLVLGLQLTAWRRRRQQQPE